MLLPRRVQEPVPAGAALLPVHVAWNLYQPCDSLSPEQLQLFLNGATPDPEVCEAVVNLLDRKENVASLNQIGEKIGRYVLIGRLGGAVWAKSVRPAILNSADLWR